VGRVYPETSRRADPVSGQPGFVVVGRRGVVRDLKPSKVYTLVLWPVDAAGNVGPEVQTTFKTARRLAGS
jgi:hypothetical protein